MTAQNSTIELLPQEEWEKTPLGKMVKWVLTIGRYIVILTELVVILAFISRFKLDKDLTDIYEDIKSKQALVEANAEFEEDFRLVQDKISQIEKIDNYQATNRQLVERLTALRPVDVIFDSLAVKNDQVAIRATALTEPGLASFASYLQDSDYFQNIILDNVHTGIEGVEGIEFTIDCQYNSESKASTVEKESASNNAP